MDTHRKRGPGSIYDNSNTLLYFGSGYSSLNVFGKQGIDRIKFDIELMRRLDDNNGANRRILRAFVNVCRELGVHTLAEGVETEPQLRFLQEIDCEMAQGF